MKVTIRKYDNKGEDVELRSFNTKRAARIWIIHGILSCEGAEQEHYASMLRQLDDGKTTVYYNEPSPPQSKYDEALEYALRTYSTVEEIFAYLELQGVV